MDNETKQALDAIREDLKNISANIADVYERVEKTETALLTAFQKWSLTSDARTKVLPSIQERLTVIEDRMTAVEHKLLERGI